MRNLKSLKIYTTILLLNVVVHLLYNQQIEQLLHRVNNKLTDKLMKRRMLQLFQLSLISCQDNPKSEAFKI